MRSLSKFSPRLLMIPPPFCCPSRHFFPQAHLQLISRGTFGRVAALSTSRWVCTKQFGSPDADHSPLPLQPTTLFPLCCHILDQHTFLEILQRDIPCRDHCSDPAWMQIRPVVTMARSDLRNGTCFGILCIFEILTNGNT